MFCTKCGAQIPGGAYFCSSCGQPANAAIASSAGFPTLPPLPYAGFWLRFVAYFIDSLLIGAVMGVILVIAVIGMGGLAFIRTLPDRFNSNDPALIAPFFVLYFLLIGVTLAGGWLYYAMMESSPRRGTFGKVVMGLTVTDLNAQQITFGRASGRFFAKIVTGLIPLGIGYIMAGFTEKKQALHDMIASCLVLKKL
jgi:uncharacterized RDD family membrane protein YckC